MATTDQLQLPYELINTSDIASRDERRAAFKRGDETYWIEFDKIIEVPGRNPRYIFTGISELADKIAVNGLTPMVVDYLKDGRILLDQGHRRFKALTILKEKGYLDKLDIPGIKDGKVRCFVNDKEVTELDRYKRALYDNDHCELHPVEQADIIWRMKYFLKLTMDEIKLETRLSRQHIENRLSLAEQSPLVKKAILDGFATPTVITELVRVVKTPERVDEVVAGMVKDKKKLRGSTVAEIKDREEKEDENPDEKFDESREEILWCQNVIRNLDKITSIVKKAGNDDLTMEVERLADFSQKDMASIRAYVKKHKRR